eukprot:Gb_39892 [translate_table: standard]
MIRMNLPSPLVVTSLLTACLIAWFLQILVFSPISDPEPLQLPPSPKLEGPFAKNNILQRVEKLGEGTLIGPEDAAVDAQGLIYTANRDGWIKRMHPNRSWENWKNGLLKVDEKVSLLASEVEGTDIRFANAMAEGSDGSIYFSDASTKYGYDKGPWLRARVLKYWLKGEKRGETEIFIDNLPGGPDNIKLTPDGSFWIALLRTRSRALECVYRYGFLKHMFAANPRMLEWIGYLKGRAMVLKVGADGRAIKSVQDWNGKVISLVTSAVEIGDYLHLGNLGTNYLGRLSLKKIHV